MDSVTRTHGHTPKTHGHIKDSVHVHINKCVYTPRTASMGLELGFRLHTKHSVHGLIELLKIEVDELLRL